MRPKFQLLSDELASNVLGINLPFISDQMADVLFIEDFRSTLVRTLKNGVESAVNPDPDTFITMLLHPIRTLRPMVLLMGVELAVLLAGVWLRDRFEAGLDEQGRLLGWRNISAGPAIVHQVLGRLFGAPGAGPDKTTAEGALDQRYEWPAARIAHHVVPLPVPVGFWRAVGHSHQAFWLNRELAHLLGRPQHQVSYCGSVPAWYRDEGVVVHEIAASPRANPKVPDGLLV